MNFSLTSSKELIDDDLSTAFAELIRKETPVREPSQAVKLLYDTEPTQLNFKFSSPKKA